ncbi:low affinity immunoglobulin gamma Fc region receptor II-like isoform X1 [Sciurus carolinensis]|uniref:low affinity immunoglobulin gamma Fc region receptor II-like isoform X1 n=1 Tax=Sciurus carolinensis TaxID=30640 RepID=UPI001FB35EBA|nr:low affinity immunoglobulin gamma Fc region receptor II-like isoform X1 [Sciurus carolinensis]
MRVPSFLPLLATESDWTDSKPSQTLGHMLLWTAVLLLAPVAGTPDLPKSVVKLEPPWIQVLKEDYVTLKCQGARNTEDHSTQWFHNRSLILTQTQPSYRFKAKNDDSGEYTCQMNQTSLSDPVHLDVHSDWLLLQTSQLVFQEGDTIILRCHSWKNNPLNKITFYQNGNSKQFSHYNNNFSIPLANQSHSGDYYCKASVGRRSYSSKSVSITVQGSKSTHSSLAVIILPVVTGIAVAAIVATIVVLIYLKRKRTSALLGNPEHREMGETLPEELGEYSIPFGDSMMSHPGLPDGSEPATSGLSNPTDYEEAAKTEAENTISYSLLMHPEAQEEEPDYQNRI